MEGEFQEIGHCGGKFTIKTRSEAGRRSVSFGYSHARVGPVCLFGVYALQPGILVGMLRMGGIGGPFNSAPVPGALPVLIASDREGKFGHLCPQCKGYWRSDGPAATKPIVCAYCGLIAEGHHFLTDGQRKYVEAFCSLVANAYEADADGEHVINMDQVANDSRNGIAKPTFYHAEQSQQNRFKCNSCKSFNDILGRFGYCSACGVFNGHDELRIEIDALTKRMKPGEFENIVKNSVAAFDSVARQYAKQLVQRIPMTDRFKKKWERKLFHQLAEVAVELASTFDIHLFQKFKDDDIRFAKLMFHRRHVYEHNGGEADDKYVRDSGDNSVKTKQALRETEKTTDRCLKVIVRLGENLHEGFHNIFPCIGA